MREDKTNSVILNAILNIKKYFDLETAAPPEAAFVNPETPEPRAMRLKRRAAKVARQL